MKTLQQQTLPFTEDLLILSVADSHANHSPTADTEKVQKTPDTFGRKCSVLYEKFAPHGSWEKTFLDSLIGTMDWSSTQYAMTWKMKATQSSRLYCQLQALGRNTSEKEYGSLPTPTANDWKDINARIGHSKQQRLIHRLQDYPRIERIRIYAKTMGFPYNWTESAFQNGQENP